MKLFNLTHGYRLLMNIWEQLKDTFQKDSKKKWHGQYLILGFAGALLLLQGCTGVTTIPKIARAGDTVSFMVGGSEQARKDTIDVIIRTMDGSQEWDLQLLGKIRSVFNVRADGRAAGVNYGPYLDQYISWSVGHEPVQTMVVVDLPTDLPIGILEFVVTSNVSDNSSGASGAARIEIIQPNSTVITDLIEGTQIDKFLRQAAFGGQSAVDFPGLEPAPHAKVTFSAGSGNIGAVSMVLNFNEIVVDPADISIFVPEAVVRGSYTEKGQFGDTQRMVYWRQDGFQVFVDIVAPQGIDPRYLQFFMMHPTTVTVDPGFSIASYTTYSVDGTSSDHIPNMQYFP